MEHQLQKGTFDILPYGAEESWQLSDLWQFVEREIRDLCADYGYREIRTPVYEGADLFDRSVGETSDIVTKEMFNFLDRGGRKVTLRPEGTSSVMRAFIQHRLSSLRPVHKFFYIAPMFRYERPQSGRYRQHHQFGVEAIGNPNPEQDAEAIDLLWELYRRLGLKNLRVHINTVGDLESRLRFKEALLLYLKPRFQELSAESQIRFEKNPLRILDSKDLQDQKIVQEAPSILKYLTPKSASHFDNLRRALDAIEVPYVVDDRIIRGLDYYNQTVFEVLGRDVGAQNTLGGGGRFDGLISSLGGPDLPAVGFATGLERVLQTMEAQQVGTGKSAPPFVYFIPMGEESRSLCFSLATGCRRNRIRADIELNGKKMQTAIQNALRIGACYCAIIGTEELGKGIVQLKNLQTREQQEVPVDRLLNRLKELSDV